MNELSRDRSPIPGLSTLAAGADVWRFSLDLAPDHLETLASTLNEEERARRDRFRGDRLQNRFVAARGTLRAILGRYLGIEPRSVEFAYTDRGKPALKDAGELMFNLSHTGGSAVCVVTAGVAVGIDVEEIRAIDNAERIIDRYFTQGEQAEFLAENSEGRPLAFFRGWTRKEAVLKAIGVGLSAPLDAFEVSLGPDPGPQGTLLRRIDEHPLLHGQWVVREVDLGSGLVCAIATERAVAPVRVREWDGL